MVIDVFSLDRFCDASRFDIASRRKCDRSTHCSQRERVSAQKIMRGRCSLIARRRGRRPTKIAVVQRRAWSSPLSPPPELLSTLDMAWTAGNRALAKMLAYLGRSSGVVCTRRCRASSMFAFSERRFRLTGGRRIGG